MMANENYVPDLSNDMAPNKTFICNPSINPEAAPYEALIDRGMCHRACFLIRVCTKIK
jgi:hypothetical protein